MEGLWGSDVQHVRQRSRKAWHSSVLSVPGAGLRADAAGASSDCSGSRCLLHASHRPGPRGRLLRLAALPSAPLQSSPVGGLPAHPLLVHGRPAKAKGPKYYPADDVPVKETSARELASKGVAKLRKSIKPGTVLILLAGRFRGRRCVFLKQLPSGLLLVSGPYAVNGVPLRRVNQAYVIATSTTVDVKGVDAKKFTDGYFGKAKVTKSQKAKKKEEDFMAEAPAAPEVTAERKADQATVDGKIKVDSMMAKYLKARFSLSKGDKPHKMIF